MGANQSQDAFMNKQSTIKQMDQLEESYYFYAL